MSTPYPPPRPLAPTESYRLLGTHFSLFTNKLSSYLSYKRLPYTTILASTSIFRDIIAPKTNFTQIPVLLLPDGTALQDTRNIIRWLETAHPPAPGGHPSLAHGVIPATKRRAAAANLIEVLSDQWLVIHAMFWRWAPRSAGHRSFILSEFGETMIGGAKAPFQKRLEMEKKAKNKFYLLLPGLGITEKTEAAIEGNFNALMELLEKHLEKWHYLLGDRVSLADFGLYGPMYAHVCRDPVSSYEVATRWPLVFEWCERVGGMGRAGGWNNVELYDPATKAFWWDYPTSCELEKDDVVPETLKPVLAFMLRDYLPILRRESEALRAFLEDETKGKVINGWKRIPRRLGMHKYSIEDGKGRQVEGERGVMTHGVWMIEESIREVGDGRWWEDVVGKEGADDWRGMRKAMQGWEVVRGVGIYQARRRGGEVKL